MKTSILETLAELATIQSTRFASLTYRAKGTGELARHTILLGVNHETAYKKDLARLLILQPRLNGIKQVACQELIDSLKNSLEKGIGQNDAYTCKDVYKATSIKGVKLHEANRELHLLGYSVSKTVLEKGVYPNTKSSEKTIAKNELKKLGRLSKIRQFVLSLDTLQDVKVNGKEIVFI